MKILSLAIALLAAQAPLPASIATPAPAQAAAPTGIPGMAAVSGRPNLLQTGVTPVPERLWQRAEQLLEARSARLLVVSANGEAVLVTTRFGQTMQLHVVEKAMGARTQLTFGREPVTGPRRLPHGPAPRRRRAARRALPRRSRPREVVGRVTALGAGATRFRRGDRIGLPWLGGTCGHCRHCAGGRENLCDAAVFTGYHRDGGYARFAVADERFCLALPDAYDDAHAAPLLCAGLIGYRAYAMAPGAARRGLSGFGAAAPLVAQVAVAEGREVFAFTRPGDTRSQDFARSLGCAWAGGSDAAPPAPLDAPCASLPWEASYPPSPG